MVTEFTDDKRRCDDNKDSEDGNAENLVTHGYIACLMIERLSKTNQTMIRKTKRATSAFQPGMFFTKGADTQS